ncbi:hypothetical protein ACQ4PT_023112 [Festuca glaucescens]
MDGSERSPDPGGDSVAAARGGAPPAVNHRQSQDTTTTTTTTTTTSDAPVSGRGQGPAIAAAGAGQGPAAAEAGSPGEKFQSHVLSQFQTIVSFVHLDPLCSSSPGDLWLTPPFINPCFSAMNVERILNFFFCSPPERLKVGQISAFVFKTQFASPDLAKYVAVWGSWQMQGFDFGFHCRLEDAENAALKIRIRDPLPVRVPPQPQLLPATRGKAFKRKAPAVNTSPGLLRLPVASIVHSSAQGMGELAESPSCLAEEDTQCGAGREEPVSLGFIAPPAATHRSYLDALLSPAAPPLPSPAKCNSPRSVMGNCFRCLAPLRHHSVATCRDPLACRGCGRSGHRLHECTMSRSPPPARTATPPSSPSAPTSSRPSTPRSSPTIRPPPPPPTTQPPDSPRPSVPFPSALGSPRLRASPSSLAPLRMQPFSPQGVRRGSGSSSGVPALEDLPVGLAAPPPPLADSPPPRDVHACPAAPWVRGPRLPHRAPSSGAPTASPADPSSVYTGSERSSEGDVDSQREVGRGSRRGARSIPGHSDRPEYMEIYMPPGDLEAARRLAVVWLDPPHGFYNNAQSITVALLRALPGAHFELVQSGLGAAYVRFRTHAAREAAVSRPPFMHEDVRITLEREEEAQRVPVQDEVCALLWASPLAAENVTPEGISALFAGFGDVVEIDPTCFGGSDMSSVKVVARCERPNLVPCDVWPKKGPWGTRVVQVEVIEAWPLERSYVDGVYQRFFDPPPPLLFRPIPRALPGRPLHAAPGASTPAAGRGSAAAPSAYVGHGRPLLLTGPAAPVAPPSSPASGVSTVSAQTSVGSPAVSEAWCSSERSSLTSATSIPARPRTSVVITELLEEPADVAAVTASAVAADQLPDEDESLWAAVIDSAHHRRKARGKAKRVHEAVRKSGRIAAQATDMHETVYAKAVKVRELKDALKGCSAKLQAHVSKSKVMQKLLSPMGMKSVSALKAAAFGKNGLVHGGADD